MFLVGVGFDSKCDFAPHTIFLGLFLCPWMWGIFGGIQHSPVYGCSALSYNFGALTGEDEHVSFYSAISKGDSFSRGWWVFKLGLEGDRQSVKFCFIPSSFHHSEETNLKTHPEEIYIRLIFFDQSVFPRGLVKSKWKENTQLCFQLSCVRSVL